MNHWLWLFEKFFPVDFFRHPVEGGEVLAASAAGLGRAHDGLGLSREREALTGG